jgi:hypothetical protein
MGERQLNATELKFQIGFWYGENDPKRQSSFDEEGMRLSRWP